MATPRVLVLRAPGTNCDQETAYAFEQAGAVSDIRHVFDVRQSPGDLARYQVLCIPGGFSYGDDVAAGRLFALQLEKFLTDALHEFVAQGKLILGICNGFQTLLKAGLLDDPGEGRVATLTWNDHGRYEDRWVHLEVRGDRCVFLRGVKRLYLPIAHAEGKFVARDEKTLTRLDTEGRLALRYALPEAGDENVARSEIGKTLPFPVNPNGSQADTAGCCDATGRVFGLMPHPERHIDALQHPRWTRGEANPEQQGTAIFANAVEHFR